MQNWRLLITEFGKSHERLSKRSNTLWLDGENTIVCCNIYVRNSYLRLVLEIKYRSPQQKHLLSEIEIRVAWITIRSIK